ncbi:signal peptidase I [Paenibacillus sp. FSL K6-1230]|uniref:signal peptidase I n=1 Tax=Paenibacillus sp. FSL K6-1230 TaxID=2921603 RepID=UPI0030F6A9CD
MDTPVRDRLPSGEDTGQKTADAPWLTELKEWLRMAVIGMLIVLLMNLFIVNLSTVRGYSMHPTLTEGQHVLVNKWVFHFWQPQRGEVVVLRDPQPDGDGRKLLIKRVVGVPGDTVEIRSGQLYINGKLQLEAYTMSMIEGDNYGPLKLEESRFFVMGDNRHYGSSKDSRYFGSVDRHLISGRAEFVFWPWDERKLLR